MLGFHRDRNNQIRNARPAAPTNMVANKRWDNNASEERMIALLVYIASWSNGFYEDDPFGRLYAKQNTVPSHSQSKNRILPMERANIPVQRIRAQFIQGLDQSSLRDKIQSLEISPRFLPEDDLKVQAHV